ncbi:hypothetical protein ET445_02755 [Agromyces protaetiae]|uniref:Uncharacterized protein n=1 Tax=Agromyces protaetiae TaxID=2509455 RepID=A0A4P6F8J4_9MICO|nr:hypothetical protein [Agromyces protaetiae]QAY72420.1 hypothetical protein ET445_02755 [Agromyces protaetiae]
MIPLAVSLPGIVVYAIGIAIRSGARIRMRGDSQVRTVLRVARQVGLDVESAETGDRIADRLRRQARISLLTIPLWAALGVGFAFALPTDAPLLLTLVPLWAAVACQQFGESVAGVVEGFRLDPDRARVATARLRTRADYADPFVRIGSRILVTFSALATAVLLAAGGPDPAGTSAGISMLAAVAALVAADLLAGALARRRQHAANREELVWDDALRAIAINNVYSTPFLLAIYPLIATAQALSGSPGMPAWITLAGALTGVVTGGAVMAYSLAIIVRRPAERMTRRLAAEDAAEASA